MERIVFLDRATLAPQIRLRRPAFAHELDEFPRTGPAEVVARLQGASIAITNKVVLTAAMLEQLPQLRLVAGAATGTDQIDKQACARLGIAVANIRGYAVHTVPEHVFALILALRRQLLVYREQVLAGRWQETEQFCFFSRPIHDLHGSRLGIVGAGSLGRRVAAIGRAFGMEPRFAARKGQPPQSAEYLRWEELLATSDVISLHCPLAADTQGLIGAAEFATMQRQPLLINTARGGLVDEDALRQALEQGLISGAGFDVADTEPPPADGIMMRLARRSDFILTPHVAWASDEGQQALADQLIDNLEHFISGRPRNLLVPGRR